MKTTMVSVSDQDLISRYLRGEKSAFETLVLRHKNRIYSYVQQMVRDRELANDIFQSVFLKALETLNGGRYQEEGKFLPWLMRIAHNQCIDHFRREKRMPMLNATDERDVFEYLDLREENAQDRIMRRQTHETMRKMVAHLPRSSEKFWLCAFTAISPSAKSPMPQVSASTPPSAACDTPSPTCDE